MVKPEVVTDVETETNRPIIQIDPRWTVPTASQIERWSWCAPVGDPDAGTIGESE